MSVRNPRGKLGMDSNFVFDQPHYDALNSAREATLGQLLKSLKKDLELRTAVDVGCGLGHFAVFLRDLGFDVLALDGRQENVNEARRRSPDLEFRVVNAEDTGIQALGKFDLVLCLGLLYHLENPFVAVRNLFAMTGKVAILEGVCVPGDEPIFAVRDESPTEDQGLRHVALYPSESGLVKLLYCSGFSHVYRLRTRPALREYGATPARKQIRTMLVAAPGELSGVMLTPAGEPPTHPDPWTIRHGTVALVRRTLRPLVHLWRTSRKQM
jgi:SAM-dependent methyltransferase